MLKIEDFWQAAERIRGRVRQTPLIPVMPLNYGLPSGTEVWFKPECFQVTGSFKVRGGYNRVLSLAKDDRERGLITASGGNFGAAVAYIGADLGVPVTVFVMNTCTPLVQERIRSQGAELVVHGDFWDHSRDAAHSFAQEGAKVFLHPFADEMVIAGQGTIGLEIMESLPDVDTIVVAIGGGGLIAGIANAAKLMKPSVRVIGVEAAGCPTLHAARRAGKVVKLENVHTKVPILAARSTEEINFEIIERSVDEIVLIDDDVVAKTASLVWRQLGIAIELGAATAVTAVLDQHFPIRSGEKIAVVLCGSGLDGLPKDLAAAAGAPVSPSPSAPSRSRGTLR